MVINISFFQKKEQQFYITFSLKFIGKVTFILYGMKKTIKIKINTHFEKKRIVFVYNNIHEHFIERLFVHLVCRHSYVCMINK